MMRLRQILFFIFATLAVNNLYGLDYHISGFGTFGYGKTNEKTTQFFGYDSDWSHKPDSLIGVQLDFIIDNKFSWTTQVVSRAQSLTNHDDYHPEVEWFYGSYRMTPEWRLRVGRLRSPLYYFSDELEVGYSYPWVRPPVSVYNQTVYPLSNFDGIDLSYIKLWGDFDVEIRGRYGAYKKKTTNNLFDINVEANNAVGFNISLSNDWLTLQYAVSKTNIDLDVPATQPINDILTAANHPKIDAILKSSSVEDINYLYNRFSIGIEWESWILHSEHNSLNTDAALAADVKGYYLSLGYEFDSLTPYIIYGTRNSELGSSMAAMIDAAYTDPTITQTGALDLGLSALRDLSTVENEQDIYVVGMRYDFIEKWALKIEWMRSDPMGGTAGNLTVESGEPVPKHLDIYTIAVEFIF